MTAHETLSNDITRCIALQAGCAILSPAAIAVACLEQHGAAELDPVIRYAAYEHIKNMARKALAGRFAIDGTDNAAYDEQGELFTGHLQDRYPIPRKQDEEPVYKLRDELTDDEVEWNVGMLKRSARARLKHADALQAWHITRGHRRAA